MADSIDKELYERLREVGNTARLPVYPSTLEQDGDLDAAKFTLDQIRAANPCMF